MSIDHHDAAGRLRLLRHTEGQRTLGHFEYQVDGRGSRTQATEFLLHPPTTVDVVIAYDDASISYKGVWSDDDPFKVADTFSARLAVLIAGREVSFTYGVGPDHSIFDVYIGKTLWQSYDGYAPSTDEVTQTVELRGDGPHLFEFRNRPERNAASTGFRIHFKQILLPDIAYDLRTIQYTYDNLSRLVGADYNNGAEIFTYGFDLAGNLTNLNGVSRTYNAANQLIHDGTNNLTYDNNGSLTADGVNTYTWDRANRLLEVDTGTPAELTAYAYDGLNNRISQAIGTSSPVVTQYLLDTQPGLVKVLRESDGLNTYHYIHSLRGVHARYDGSAWNSYIQDGLGSVRGLVDASNAVLSNIHYTEYGVPDVNITGPAFTGEWRDETEIQYHRARYLSPGLGTWLSLDPFEGTSGRPMSLNGYMYVEGNVVMHVDPSGMRPRCQTNELCQAGSLEPSGNYDTKIQMGCIEAPSISQRVRWSREAKRIVKQWSSPKVSVKTSRRDMAQTA